MTSAAGGLDWVSHAQRPELLEQVERLESESFPPYILADPHWPAIAEFAFGELPEWQLYLIGDDGRLLGLINTVTLHWDGEPMGLPAGYHEAVSLAREQHAARIEVNTLMGLQAIIDGEVAGRGLISAALRILPDVAAGRGLAHVIGSIRPTGKGDYPLIALADYACWRLPAGPLFDPWLRVQEAVGGQAMGVSRAAMVFSYPVAEWEAWCGYPMPADGQYVVPGAHAPLVVHGGQGTVQEYGVWFNYPVA